MTDTIHLDPWDIYQLSSGLGKSFEELRAAGILALHEEEGMILPHLRMQIKKDNPDLPAYETFEELAAAIRKAL